MRSLTGTAEPCSRGALCVTTLNGASLPLMPAGVVGGLDALLSIAQMPSGVPVATMAIGGAANAALYAARILALRDAELARKLEERVARVTAEVEAIEL